MKKISVIAVVLCLLLVCSTAVACNPIENGIGKDGTVYIGATSVPHAEILEFAKDILLEDYNIRIEVQRVDEYSLLNPATAAGDTFANYFQHGIYLEEYNQSVAESDRLVSVCSVHVEPLGIYKGGKATGTTLQEILEKDSLVISLTNDATNQSRALRLLESLGVITVTNDKEIITAEDCDWQGHQYREINASLLGSSLADVDLAVIPGNYALLAGLKEALATEDSSVTSQYANIIAVRPENLDSDIAKALKEVLTGEEVAQFIADKYGDAVQVVK